MAKKDGTPAPPAGMDDARVERVRGEILAWFRENARDLPWRRTREPWRTLVSEVMLQQIQVKRAIPFYERFLRRFPTVESLSNAPLSEAIRAWGDLGRYRRVVNLHRTARILVEEHGGRVPDDPETLAALPGIGPYTAGAVACFAHEKDVAFADTNMLRVLHRLFFGPEVAGTARRKEVLAVAEKLVPPGGGWEWNQALMEFGALRCTARKPLCDGCPLSEMCLAKDGIPDAVAARSANGNGSPRYRGTNREYRGRVLAQLRNSPDAGLGVEELGRRLGEEMEQDAAPWLRGAVESLAKDGLVVVEEGRRYEAGAVGAIAEQRAAYGAGNGDERPKEPQSDARVRLP